MRTYHLFAVLGIMVWLLGIGWAQNPQGKALTLEECIHIALQNNSQLRLASYQKQLAHFTYRGSFQDILPSLRLSYGTFKFERGPTSYLGGEYVGKGIPALDRITRQTDYSFSINFSQNIYDGGYWWNNIHKTHVDEQAQSFNYEAEKQSTILNVMQRYFTLLKEIKLLQVYQQAVERSQKQLERAQRMYELGSAARVDVYRAQVNLGNDKIRLLNQQNVVAKARRDLNLAMGRDPGEPLEIVPEFELEKKREKLQNLIQKAMQQNPTLRKMELDIQSSHLQTKLASRNFYPQISAFFTYSRRTPEFRGLYRELSREYNWTFGLNFSWNLFNGFGDYINVQKAKVNESLAREQYLDYQRNLISTIQNLYQTLKAYDEIIAINKENLKAAQEEYRLAEERYRVGSGTALELRDAQVNLTQAEQVLVSAEYDAVIAYSQLQEALGELLEKY